MMLEGPERQAHPLLALWWQVGPSSRCNLDPSREKGLCAMVTRTGPTARPSSRERHVQVQSQQNHRKQSRSGSDSVRKRKPRGRKKQGREDDALPQYASPTMPPPLACQHRLGEECTPANSDGQDMAVEERAEMMQALKTAYPDPQERPDHVKKIVDKYDVKTTEQLRKEMHRTTDSISKARKLPHQLQDARTKHRKSWLKHLTNLATTLEKQVEAFDHQQKDYQERIQRSRKEIQISRRALQRLNVQAAETAIPEVTIEDDNQVEPPSQDAEEAELRSQVSQILRKCFKASSTSTAKDTIELLSDDEGEVEMDSPRMKRPRSSKRSSGHGLS